MERLINDKGIQDAWMRIDLDEQGVYLPADGMGLFVHIRRGAAPIWILRDGATNATLNNRIIGTWPEMSISQALAEARVLRREFLSAPTRVLLMGEVLKRYRAAKLSSMSKGEATYRSLLLICEAFVGRPVLQVRSDDVEGAVAKMAIDAPVHANRTLAYLSAFFSWCIEQGLVDRNPTQGLRRIAIEVPRERTLSAHELTEVWWATAGLRREFRLAIRLLILTAARREEVAAMRASNLKELEEGVFAWTLPRTDRPPFRIVLRDLATDPIYEALAYQRDGQDFLFTTTGRTPISGWSKIRRRVDDIIWEGRRRRQGDLATPMEPWRLNDLRPTFRALAQERLKEDPAVLESCLDRKSAFSVSGWDWALSDEMAELRDRALAKWARFLEGSLQETAP